MAEPALINGGAGSRIAGVTRMQQLVNGVFMGSIYALFAMGYTLVFGVLDRLNLAHSAVFMVGAFVGLKTVTALGLPLWVAVVAALAVGAGLGVVIERIAFAPLQGRPDAHFAGLISSIALAIILGALALAVVGPNTVRFPPDTFPSKRFDVGTASISLLQIVVMVISLTLMTGLQWLVTSTRLGTAMRAVAENPRAARVLGIDVERVTVVTFALSSALGAAAGVMFALAFNSIRFNMGLAIELKGLAVIIVGGMGSLAGAMIGGVLLGLGEVFAITFVSSSWRDAVAFGLLFLILIVRPQGLLGRKPVREV